MTWRHVATIAAPGTYFCQHSRKGNVNLYPWPIFINYLMLSCASARSEDILASNGLPLRKTWFILDLHLGREKNLALQLPSQIVLGWSVARTGSSPSCRCSAGRNGMEPRTVICFRHRTPSSCKGSICLGKYAPTTSYNTIIGEMGGQLYREQSGQGTSPDRKAQQTRGQSTDSCDRSEWCSGSNNFS